MSGDTFGRLVAAIDEELPGATELRHRIHREPYVSGDETVTRDLVLAALPAGETVKVADTGAVVRFGAPGPAVAVRAELDALDVAEATDVPWRSARPGVMHACGHDVHLAALAALVRAVDRVGGPSPIVAVLQPREETQPSGAREIADDGILERWDCRATIGAHVQPLLSRGTIACTPGVVNASADEFVIRVRGEGGHAGYPHLTRDPVVALAQVVVALQSMVSRGVDPMASVVVSVTMLEAGSAANVVPGVAAARGTIRAMTQEDRVEVIGRMTEVVEAAARAAGCAGEVEIYDGQPVLENDALLAGATAPMLGRLGMTVTDTLRSTGSDDFSFFSERMPTLMLFVGTDGGTERLHSPTFLPADERIRDVAHALLSGYVAAAGLCAG